MPKSHPSLAGERPSRYSVRNGAIAGHKQERCFNRPLYIANTSAFVLAGDRPILRFASDDTMHGTLQLGMIRRGRTHWLHEMADLTTEFRASHVCWTIRDAKLKGLTITLEVVPLSDEVGFATRAKVEGAKPGDTLLWAYGGAVTWPEKNMNWEMDPLRETTLVSSKFDPASSEKNQIRVRAGSFTLAPARGAARQTLGQCSISGGIEVADAATIFKSTQAAASRPLVIGKIDLQASHEIAWSFLRTEKGEAPVDGSPTAPMRRFLRGLEQSTQRGKRLVIETPDARLNAVAAMLPAAIDGAWYPPVFHHGAMLWNLPFPGWRTVFGGTTLGWHDRVKAQAKYYTSHQETKSTNCSYRADPERLLTMPTKDSRFFGRGRIIQDQSIYNMQSQFFDQLIHAWKWTGDAELETLLRPALDLHLEWLKDCFDPDNDGLYESYINTWPTDSIWHSGGGSTEETAYAYRAHTAAQELAARAGDKAGAKRHAKQANRIRSAFRRKLWIADKGHAGFCREPDGLRRLHEDAWLYSIFLPIDSGLVDPMQAAESLLYTERQLQNDRMPCGGRMVWTSNFVPAIWSVRERWPGDNYHLALSYFQTGLSEDGWDIFRGTFLQTAFDDIVPGNFGAGAGGTDFGDCTHMFARTLVEGLFGYAPDRPRKIVRVAPQFPEEWDSARMSTPDVDLRYQRSGLTHSLEVELTEPAPMEIRLPVCARGIASVTAAGRPVRWSVEPGFGRSIVRVLLPKTSKTKIEVTVIKPSTIFASSVVAGKTGAGISLRPGEGNIQSFSDPQGALSEASIYRNAVTGKCSANTGAHTLFLKVLFGELPQWRRIHLQISDPVEEKSAATKRSIRVPRKAKWLCIDPAPVLNGDVRSIYQQKYLTPRPKTISARIGSDGYSPWTFVLWNSPLPVIKLDGVPALLKEPNGDQLITPQGVPFAWPGEGKNIAFTSRWDNWPTQVSLPVNCAGEAAFFLVCGSTNPMQGFIPNAVLRLSYEEGDDEMIELVPPLNYWNLCPISPAKAAPGQGSRSDYTAEADAFCVPKPWPETVQLGENCRAMLLGWRLRPGATLKTVTLETLSADVVVGLMGVTILQPN